MYELPSTVCDNANIHISKWPFLTVEEGEILFTLFGCKHK